MLLAEYITAIIVLIFPNNFCFPIFTFDKVLDRRMQALIF